MCLIAISTTLIGIRVGTGDGAVQHSFWADNEDGEKLIWREFLDVLSAIPDPRLVHFGSYETVFLKRMRERHGGPREGSAAETAIEHAVNLLSFVFAHIYFPTCSNGLKEIAGYLGFRWSGSPASGLESIVWRHRWEASKDPSLKQALLDYNREDCEALELVANRLVDLHREAPADGQSSESDVVRTADMKRENLFKFGRIEFALRGNGEHQQSRLLGLSARAGLREVGQKAYAPSPVDFDAPLQAEAKRHDRLPAPFVLPDLQIKKTLWPRLEEQDHHRPSIYEARNKAMDYALHHTSVSMPILRKQL